jgi:dTDP-4-dehydrorhamnose reductase
MTTKILILGGAGMLGHKLGQVTASRFNSCVTVRQTSPTQTYYGLFDSARVVSRVSAQDIDSVIRAIATVRPAVVVNCIGIVKQDRAAADPLLSISVNALFPHRLAQLCQASGARLIHISTDCVFSGRKGNYLETDIADAEDLYGRTKFLGEVDDENSLTLRTSMIGRELTSSNGLVEWFLSQEGRSVRGFKRAVFSGFTTRALAEIITKIINEHPDLHGIWHVAAEPINKFELLSLIKEQYRLKIEIEQDETFVCDRSLNAGRFWRKVEAAPPSWPTMIEEMSKDSTPYAELRRIYAH